MNSAWIVDGTYLNTDLHHGRLSVEDIVQLERRLIDEQGAPMKRSVYFDLSRDVDQDLAGPLILGLRSARLRTPFDVRLIPLPETKNVSADIDARRLLAVDLAVEAIRLLGDDCDRLILTAADAALEPAVSMIRIQYSKEFWLTTARGGVVTLLGSYADRIVWID
jgi:NYN domain